MPIGDYPAHHTPPTPEAHALAYLHAHLSPTTCNTAPAFLERIAQVMVQYAAEVSRAQPELSGLPPHTKET